MLNSGNVLIVDDEAEFLDSMSEKLKNRGLLPVLAENGSKALNIVREHPLDLAIVDLRMPDMDGRTLIAKIKELQPGLQTVLLTGWGTEKVRQACESMQVKYFEKGDMDTFWQFIQQLGSEGGMVVFPPPGEKNERSEELHKIFANVSGSSGKTAVLSGEESAGSPAGNPRIIGESPVMREVRNSISKVATLDCTVIISGETGTGKELVARSIHQKSVRSAGKFLAINCGAFGQDLLNNELFGYERETLSGSMRIKKGLFEAADGGTILLDEICETPPAMQSHLLRVLEDKMIIRSGGTEEIPVDVRILASTNQRLRKKMECGEFRSDLYFRLNTFVLRLSPLRERKEDIPLLANYFLGKYRNEFGKDIDRISNEALHVLMDYSFPGNVRDLEHALERAIIVCEGDTILPEHLPRRFKERTPTSGMVDNNLVSLEELEKEHIRKVMAYTRGNKNEAANILGISRTSLWRKLKKEGESRL